MTIVDNFGPLNATSASRALQPAALGTVLLGGRRDFMQVEGKKRRGVCVCGGGGALCGFEWFAGPLHLAWRVITESWVNHACNHGCLAQ